MRVRATISLIALAAIAGAAAAQQPSAGSQVLWWEGSWEGAFAEAKTRNVPVLVVFTQDGEEASERLANATFRDVEYVKVTMRCVPIVTSTQFHGIQKQEIGGVVKGVCSKFGATTCEAHQALETPARVELCGSEVRTPQHVLLLPDKTVVARIYDTAPISAYQELIAKGAKKLGRGLTAAELKQLRDRMRDARARIENQDWAGAIKVSKEAQATAKDTPFAKEVAGIFEKIDSDGNKQIEKANAAAAAGDMVLALRTLETAVEQFAATDVAPRLKKELTKLRSSKAGGEAARVLAKEKKGQEAYDAGLAAEKAKDFLTARREYLRAISAASGTPLADRARARVDELAKDPDIKPLFERAEKDARGQAALKDAQKLLADGKTEDARAALKKIVEDYAGTPAAAAAKAKLGELR